MSEKYNRNRILKSLILNVPAGVDGFSTSPRISKVFSFPLGIKVDSMTLIKSIFNFVFFLTVVMTLACFLLLNFYLPLQAKSNSLYNVAKTATDQKFSLLVNLNETSSYTRLFSASESLSFVDPEEVIHVKNIEPAYKQTKKKLNINNYPSIQFAGF